MVTIFKRSKQVGTLDARLQLRTKDPRLRELIEQARTVGMMRMVAPAIPDPPQSPLIDYVETIKLTGSRDSLSELRLWLRKYGYEAKTTTNTPRGRR
jgi:hypothetical protein